MAAQGFSPMDVGVFSFRVSALVGFPHHHFDFQGFLVCVCALW